MADVFDKATRSAIMRSVRSTDTTAELVVRRALHRSGYRYRLHDGRLPGRPDLVFASRRKVLFVHGCFWHRHACRSGRASPKTRRAYWTAKFERNRRRDRRVRRRLERLGWKVMVVWECQLATSKVDTTLHRIKRFLGE